MLEIKQLRYAVLAAETRSFARAAALLRIKQATLSRRVSDLEHRLGVKLFERTTRGAMPTAVGAAFVANARRILADIDRLHSAARALGNGEAGELTIGFCAPLGAGHLRGLVIDFLTRYPEVRLHGEEQDRRQLRHGLQSEAIDLAVISGWIPQDGLLRRALWSERVLVAVPEGHELTSRQRIYWTDLRDERFVFSGHDPGPDLAELLRARLNEPGRQPDIAIEAISRENVLSLVPSGRFLTLASEAALGVIHPGLVLCGVHDPGGPARLDYAGYWRRENDNPALKHFLGLLGERYPG
jgi:DNA-binding transcriptional LysR family regulator